MQFLDMLIIVPCSSKKSITVSSRLHAHAVRAKTLDGYAREWVRRVRAETATFLPDEVYAGQGMAAARNAAEQLEGELHILSAGLSIVSPTTRIPGYNLTISHEGPRPFDNISESAKAADWWLSLNRAFGTERPLAKLIKSHDAQVIVALPTSYLSMVECELAAIGIAERKKLRIITSVNTVLKSELAAIAIRYDQRLNVAEGAPHGANASFIQRALLHLSRLLSENSRTRAIASQQSLVDRALGTTIPICSPLRHRVTDAALLKLIESALRNKIIARTTLLEIMRRDNNIACEQHRFSNLYDQVLTVRK